MQTFEKQFPSLKDKEEFVRREKDIGKTEMYCRRYIQKHCLDKVRVQEALTKYSNLNNKMIKSFESMEEAQALNDAGNTMMAE